MFAQSTLISYHTEAFVKKEVGCTVRTHDDSDGVNATSSLFAGYIESITLQWTPLRIISLHVGKSWSPKPCFFKAGRTCRPASSWVCSNWLEEIILAPVHIWREEPSLLVPVTKSLGSNGQRPILPFFSQVALLMWSRYVCSKYPYFISYRGLC